MKRNLIFLITLATVLFCFQVIAIAESPAGFTPVKPVETGQSSPRTDVLLIRDANGFWNPKGRESPPGPCTPCGPANPMPCDPAIGCPCEMAVVTQPRTFVRQRIFFSDKMCLSSQALVPRIVRKLLQ